MIISDTTCMIDVFTIALLTLEFGQVWASSTLGNVLNTIQLCKPRFTKTHTTLDSIVDLGNRIAYNFVKLELQNCVRLWERSHDCTIVQLPFAQSCPTCVELKV